LHTFHQRSGEQHHWNNQKDQQYQHEDNRRQRSSIAERGLQALETWICGNCNDDASRQQRHEWSQNQQARGRQQIAKPM
jgi:hypothetical protein